MAGIPIPAVFQSIEQALIALRIAGYNYETWLKLWKLLNKEGRDRVLVALAEPGAGEFLTENMKQKLALFLGDESVDASTILKSEERFLKIIEEKKG
jgi:hypothetical protein